jgi:hypothetical protein
LHVYLWELLIMAEGTALSTTKRFGVVS